MGSRVVKISMGNDQLIISKGDQSTFLSLGRSQTEAMQSIELTVGQSSIVINQQGVTIKGMMISIQGQVQVQVSASGMLQCQGGIVMIN